MDSAPFSVIFSNTLSMAIGILNLKFKWKYANKLSGQELWDDHAITLWQLDFQYSKEVGDVFTKTKIIILINFL